MKNADKIKLMVGVAKEVGLVPDRFNNIKWVDLAGRTVRYKFKKNVIRKELYIPEIGKGEWMLLGQSLAISKINVDGAWRLTMSEIQKGRI